MNLNYPFTEEEVRQANEAWGCNCGPTALAFALQIPLSRVCGKIPGFEDRGYTSPTMMKGGLAKLGAKYVNVQDPNKCLMFLPKVALVRVQWTGPWTAPGANPKWAYRQTHWIAAWGSIQTAYPARVIKTVFDCNGGIRSFGSWEKEIVPLLTASIKRADGGWYPTHIWRVEP